MPFEIAVIPGDGIGPDVIDSGLQVLDAIGSKFDLDYRWDSLPWGCEYYTKTGRMMPEDGIDVLAPDIAGKGEALTPDLGGKARTSDVTAAVIAQLAR